MAGNGEEWRGMVGIGGYCWVLVGIGVTSGASPAFRGGLALGRDRGVEGVLVRVGRRGGSVLLGWGFGWERELTYKVLMRKVGGAGCGRRVWKGDNFTLGR